uniref:Uncharacterized protein n=1 Tax=Arundo donax TaxID=35708 RepID=A0A0A8Z9S5_ARUDO
MSRNANHFRTRETSYKLQPHHLNYSYQKQIPWPRKQVITYAH